MSPRWSIRSPTHFGSGGTRWCWSGCATICSTWSAVLDEIRPDLVFNGVEAFHGNAGLEYMVPGMLEAEGYHYTGSPPLALLVSRNKAMSKKVLAYHGIRVPGFVTYRPGETAGGPPTCASRSSSSRSRATPPPASPRPRWCRTRRRWPSG